MKVTQKTMAVVIGSAFAASIAATSVNAAENPFAIKSLASGYMVAENDADKMKDGKCGAGKCGAEKSKMMKEKVKDGKCSAEKMKEGNCSAEMKEKMKEGTTGSEAK